MVMNLLRMPRSFSITFPRSKTAYNLNTQNRPPGGFVVFCHIYLHFVDIFIDKNYLPCYNEKNSTLFIKTKI